MPKRNEHVLAIMLEPYEIGQKFEQWPLHITIVPWFPAKDEQALDNILINLAKGRRSFYATVGPVEHFGSNKDVAVSIVNPHRSLTKLHNDTLKALDKADMAVHQRDYVGPNYRAHITHQSHNKPRTDEKYRVNEFCLVQQERLKKSGRMIKSIKKAYTLTG